MRRFSRCILMLLLATSTGCGAQTGPAVIKVNAGANRHPISPLIYGVAYASREQLLDLNAPLNRMGGNNSSRYNWRINADNRGNDWFFETIGDASAVPGARGDAFIQRTRGAGAEPLVTIPMIGWVAKLGPNRGKLASFSVAKYGPQQKTDQWMPDAGNGYRPDGKPVVGNDPNDSNVLADVSYQTEWVEHIVHRWGPAAKGGLRYYILDNEPSIWHGTHRDVHPVGATMDEVLLKTIDYAAHIKAVDPGAQIVGPEEWGWSGFIYSGYDQQYGAQHGWHNLGGLPDRNKHGGMDYLPWLLDQLHKHDAATGKRSLDVFTVHWYPQGGEFGGSVSTEMQLRRNRSTRSLWDPDYTDETWIKDRVYLIPRIKGWVKRYYPGLKIGITEYNWSAEDHINGATAQADVYGIFGREGLDIGCRWTTPKTGSPTYNAMKMYRNYDGKRSIFGNTSVACSVPNPDVLAAFASIRSSDGALTVMAINKALNRPAAVRIDLAGFTPRGPAQVWQLTSANEIKRVADAPIARNDLSTTLPSQSITLFVIPGS